MNNKKLTIIYAIIALLILIISGISINKQYGSKHEGKIKVQLVNLNNEITLEKNIEFREGDTLINLLNENFENVKVENGMLMSIEDFYNADDYSTFISIYVDNELSMVGILDIEFEDGTIISFKMCEGLDF